MEILLQRQTNIDLQLFAVDLPEPITVDSLPDECITDIGENIEKFIDTAEYWDKFCNHSTVKQGRQKFAYRRLIRPDVRPEDVKEMAELVAPRPTKFALATFEKSVGNYGANGEYTRADLMFHLDNTVLSLTATLKEKMRQILDLAKGKAFVSSRATISYQTSIIDTLDNASIVFMKNEINRWENNYYLAHLTPEQWKQLKAEVRERKDSLDEKTKVAINGKEEEFAVYGDWMFSITTSKVLYKGDKQIMVLQGRRGVDNQSGVEVSRMEGYGKTEFGDNGLGDGLIYDEDGNLTSDKNKQKGSCYVNALGVGVGISDDLAILNCEVPISVISGTVINLNERTGYVSTSPVSSITITAAKSSDETTIDTPTIVVKEKNASGKVVNATSGTTYPVVAGNTYYIKVSKSGFVDAELTIKANAGNLPFVVYLTAVA